MFSQTIRFVFEKLLKKWGSVISGRCTGALTDEIKTLKLTIFRLSIIVIDYSHFQFTSYGLNCFTTTIGVARGGPGPPQSKYDKRQKIMTT